MSRVDEAYAPLLARRVPRERVVPGRVYLIHARHGGVGIAVLQGERLGYRLRREKFGRVFPFVEWDWAEGPPYGTAIPLEEIADGGPPPGVDLLSWLEQQESAHKDAIRANTNSFLHALCPGLSVDALVAEPPSPREFGVRVVELVGPTATIVELACGANAAVGRALREAGHVGPILFADWRRDVLVRHETAFGPDARVAWLEGDALSLQVTEDAWLVVHCTLPRRMEGERLVKPRGVEGGARLLRELAATGARGLVALTVGVETSVLREGATALGLRFEEEPNVAWEEEGSEGVGTLHVVWFPERDANTV